MSYFLILPLLHRLPKTVLNLENGDIETERVTWSFERNKFVRTNIHKRTKVLILIWKNIYGLFAFPSSIGHQIFFIRVCQVKNFHKEKSIEIEFPFLQIETKNWTTTSDNCTVKIADKWANSETTVFIYIVLMVRKDKLQMKINSFDPNDTIFITKFLDTYKLVWDIKFIQKKQKCAYYPTSTMRHLQRHSKVVCALQTSLLISQSPWALFVANAANSCNYIRK